MVIGGPTRFVQTRLQGDIPWGNFLLSLNSKHVHTYQQVNMVQGKGQEGFYNYVETVLMKDNVWNALSVAST